MRISDWSSDVCSSDLAVGMAGHFDDGLVVLLQRAGDVVEHRVELRLHFGLVEGEGHAAGHVEGDVVALAHDVHARALHLATQFSLLAVLVGADGAPGQSANARTDPPPPAPSEE